MPDKKQHDDELVQLLARGELSDVQIAKRLGLSFSQVSRIARGEKRPELQPRIYAAMRRNLKAAWKNGGRLDTDSGEPVPPGTAQTAFDRHLAVELIASGQLTLSQIAKRLGVHKTTVSRIVAGRSHPELQGLIRETEKHYRDRARRIGVKWSAQIVMKQIQVGLKNNGWVGLRARQDLLDRFLTPEDHSDGYPPPAERDFGPGLEDLPEPLKSQVIEALGGPAADQAEDEYVYWNDPSTWKPVGAAAEAAAAEEAAAALQKNDAASRSGSQSASGPSAEQEQKNDVASRSGSQSASGPSAEPFHAAPATADLRQGKQEEASTTEEGCSRNKKRRRRQRREVDSFIR